MVIILSKQEAMEDLDRRIEWVKNDIEQGKKFDDTPEMMKMYRDTLQVLEELKKLVEMEYLGNDRNYRSYSDRSR
jgi:hypothetical protein